MDKERFSEQFNQAKFKTLFYPVTIIVFFLIVVILFVFTIRFVARVVNNVFTVSDEDVKERVISFDLEHFEKIKKELGIASETISAPPIPSPTPSLSSPPSPSNTPSPAPDKASLKIEILNGSGKKGAAAALAVKLEQAGFKVAETGNADNQAYATSVTKVKKSKADVADLVFPELASYTIGEKQELLEEDAYDMIIIIGAK